MARFRLATLSLVVLVFSISAADPTPANRNLALQKTQADAKDLLASNKPGAAAALLENQLPFADGDRAFLDLLRAAYTAELNQLQGSSLDPKKAADIRTKLTLIGGPLTLEPQAAAQPTPPPPALLKAAEPEAQDSLRQAATLFNEAKTELSGKPTAEPLKFKLAAAKFAAAFMGRVQMNSDQLTAWAYCRIRVAADQLNRSGNDPTAVNAVIREVEESLKLAPNNAGLQKVGQELLASARQRGGNATTRTPTAEGWETIDTPNFRVRFQGRRTVADSLARLAESKRDEIFARWSGPSGGTWEPKCELFVHSTADSFAQITQQPNAATGRALVKLDGGRAVERRIDVRADDLSVADDALPRELTHIVLADLFPNAAPPKWAESGMAVLAASEAEQDRYRRTLSRCYGNGELFPIETLFGLKSAPNERVTAFFVESVSLVEFLVKWKGDKAFTTFLRDSQRYGMPSALKRQYGLADMKQLEEVWMRSELSVSRGQTP